MKRYRFARLFSVDARVKIAHANWDDDSSRRVWRDGHCYCPIGLLLEADGRTHWYDGHRYDSSTEELCTEALRRSNVLVDRYDRLSMQGFMRSWDHGKIRNLALALGVEGAQHE